MLRCGLLGRKLGHSYSPAIHAMLGDYRYDLIELPPQALEDFVKSDRWDGLNVTIPYKKDVVPFCDELSPLARKLGSVNTLWRRDGKIYGDNTDAYGFGVMVKRLGVSCQGKKALVLGSGGASVTAQAVLQALGAQVVVISRRGENNYENLDRHADAAILANTTPVGMYPNAGQAPLDIARLPRLEAVLDVVYNPSRTRLILDAEAAGIPCESGLWMLVAQAVRASEIFTGRDIPLETLERVYGAIRQQMENIVLIGMPGAGKTTVGKKIAQKLNREFVDCDEKFVQEAGMSIPAYFQTYGEGAFRDLETQVLAQVTQRSGLVIATGGGCVVRPENRDLLRQNGTVVWLRRALADLPIDGRPVSQSQGIQAIYQARKPLYEAFSDFAVDNTTPQEAAQAIVGAATSRPQFPPHP